VNIQRTQILLALCSDMWGAIILNMKRMDIKASDLCKIAKNAFSKCTVL